METAETQRNNESFSDNTTSGGCNSPETSAIRPICMDDVIDDNLPESYKLVRSFFSEAELNSNEILVIVLYIMAVESGFTSDVDNDVPVIEQCYTFDSRNIKRISSQSVTNGLSNDAGYRFPLYLGTLTKCVLLAKPFSGKLIINLFAPDSLICFSKILDVASYVTDNALNKRRLKDLSANCKNDIFYPMKSYYLNKYDIKHPCLLDLPTEIIVLVMKYICVKDFMNLCASCRYLFYNFRENKYV